MIISQRSICILTLSFNIEVMGKMKKRTAEKKNQMNLKEFLDALDEIQKTKGIDKEEIVSAVEAALVSAYKKDYRGSQSVRVEIDRETGETEIYAQKTVVSEVVNPTDEISLSEAKKINLAYVEGDIVEFKVDPMDFGRVAAQNAKQLILQRIKEAERNIMFNTYADKKDEILTGIVQRIEHGDVFVDLGKAEGVMNLANQVPGEQYFQGMRLKVYVSDVTKTNKGATIFVSRSRPSLIKRLFELEIPEITDGTIEVMSISREAGSRTKIAVKSNSPEVDAVGACVGFKGIRIQNVLNEIGEEHIDVIPYSDDIAEYIANSISPAQVIEVIIDSDNRSAVVLVDDSQLSLAIGKDGQNVRLAARLTGWKIDIKSPQQYMALTSEVPAEDFHDKLDKAFEENASNEAVEE